MILLFLRENARLKAFNQGQTLYLPTILGSNRPSRRLEPASHPLLKITPTAVYPNRSQYPVYPYDPKTPDCSKS